MGGLRVDTGLDSNGDGVLETGETQHTAYVCAVATGGAGGAGGADAGGAGGQVGCGMYPPQPVDLGASQAVVTAMNDLGQVVGYVPSLGSKEAFLWAGGNFRSLGLPPSSQPNAISSNGKITGVSAGAVFLWDAGITFRCSDPRAAVSTGVDVNAAGDVVGMYTSGGLQRAFLWQTRTGTFVDLGTVGGPISQSVMINALGQVIGNSTAPSTYWHAFLWEAGTMRDLGTLGGNSSRAYAINEAGQVVGSAVTSTGRTHAVLWEGGVAHDLGTLAAHEPGIQGYPLSVAKWINRAGQIAGESENEIGETHGFFWDNGVMQDLGTLMGPGVALPDRHALSDFGEVLAGQDRYHTGVVQPFVWRAGVIDDFMLLPKQGIPVAMNNAHQVIGSATSAGKIVGGFFYDFAKCGGAGGSGGGDGGTPHCGNGLTEQGEQCDPPHVGGPLPACDQNCQITTCGNGILDPGEECDPVRESDVGHCDVTCHLILCGNGVLNAGEQCDPPDPYGWLPGHIAIYCGKDCQVHNACTDCHTLCDHDPSGYAVCEAARCQIGPYDPCQSI